MIEIKNFVDCPEVLPLVAEHIHNQWFADKPGHTVEGMLARRRTGQRAAIPIGLVAFSEGVPAGTVSLLDSDLDERRDLTPWLAGLLVFPGFRDQGVGSALTRALCEVGIELGISSMYLYTDKPGFYRRLGWQVIGDVPSHPGCFVMKSEELVRPRS
jgi:predicted N-acetyltransferase YhbS